MTYEYYCKCCGCLWTSTHSSNRCPDCNSSDFDCGDFSEDYEGDEDECDLLEGSHIGINSEYFE